jgi:SAM-dependent methyltransferase
VAKAPFDARSYWDRRLDRRFSLQGVGLVSVSRGYNRWLYRVRNRVFHRIVDTLGLEPGRAKVLDVGVGVGFYTRRWLELGVELVGVDIADSAVRRLRLRYPEVRFERLDISDDVTGVGGADGFDVVDAFDVLFHIVDDERYRDAIENIYGLLRPGGWLVFTDVCSRRRSQPSKHYVRRSLTEVEDVLRETGFELVWRQPAFVLMNYPFDSNRWHRELWRRVLAPLQRSELGGTVLGALLYWPELALIRLLKESPTTELVVCRRPAS